MNSNQIQKLIQGEVKSDEETLDSYSSDASIFNIKPSLVVYPKNSEDIKKLIEFVNQHPEQKLSLTARSAGTCMSGGAINESIILDMTKHFNQILEVNEHFALTQPGVFYRDFEKETLKHDALLPCYPASREICTVGGMVGNNSAGEKTLAFGQTHNFVKELKVILSDGNEYDLKPLNKLELNKKMTQKNFEGEVYSKVYNLIEENYDLIKKTQPKVTKNSAGYLLWYVWDKQTFDLTQLITGSQGTLGIITEAKLSLVHPKKHSKLLVIFLYDLGNLGEIINRILEYKPESFESYDDQTLKVAVKFLPQLIKSIKSDNLISLAFQFLPEVWMSLTGGIPKLILLAEFTGDQEGKVDEKCLEAQESLKEFKLKTRITKTETEAKKYWTLRRESFNLLRHHTANMRTAPFIDDIVVNHERLPEFLPKLKEIMDQYKNDLIYTIAGHVGNGNFHIIPLMDFTKPRTKEIVIELGKKVYDLTEEFKGSITGEHNDGLVRGPYLEQMFGEDVYQLFKEVKEIFDPNDIFNPHKKVDATFEYSFSHLSEQ